MLSPFLTAFLTATVDRLIKLHSTAETKSFKIVRAFLTEIRRVKKTLTFIWKHIKSTIFRAHLKCFSAYLNYIKASARFTIMVLILTKAFVAEHFQLWWMSTHNFYLLSFKQTDREGSVEKISAD